MNSATGNAGRLNTSDTVNIKRLHALMDRDDLEAIVARGGQSVTYLAGIAYHGTLARHLDIAASPRGVVVIWPRNASPVIVVDVTAAGATELGSWIKNIVVYDGYQESLFDRVGTVLEQLDLKKSRVGFDKNFIGASYWCGLECRFPNMHMADSDDLLSEVRWIKTDVEIDRFRAGANLLDNVFSNVFPTIEPGELETQVHGRIIGGCLSEGAEFAHGIFNSHRNPIIYCGESNFALKRGDIIRTDYLAYLKGYPGHQSRNAVLGPANDRQRSDYSRYYDIYRSCAEKLRVGVRIGDLFESVVERFADIGWNYTNGLIGHSVGPWWHQQDPIFCRGCDVQLLEGMVVAFEPYVDHWHCQDMFRITSGSPELLSPNFDTSEMFVID